MSDTPMLLEGQALSIDLCSRFISEIGVRVRKNLLSHEIEVTGRLSGYSEANAANTFPVILADLLKTNGVRGVTTNGVREILSCIADADRYNPIEDFLKNIKWDEQDRFPGLYNILGISDNQMYQTLTRKWMIQSVALALNDEKKAIGAEGILVLAGAQGIGKTSVFRALVPDPHWFAEGVTLDLRNKDDIMRATSAWICELGELDGTTKKEQPALKAFITQPYDMIRYPYDRATTRVARRTSFCGTVNETNFLRDPTGNRRFWVLHVDDINKKALLSLPYDSKAQLWAQTYQMYKDNPSSFRLTQQEMEWLQGNNRQYDAPLPYETEIRELLDWSLPFDQWEWWTASRLINCGLIRAGCGEARQVGRALSRVVEDFQQRGVVCDDGGPIKRTQRGTTKYFIPLHSFTVVQGGSAKVESVEGWKAQRS
ncbi:VapE domain-containing protein [uncultured Agathobaculum sp.]|uniref:VapE domain-containing protein n=1 Tax=uncultured Agathobaculum sp. TaxID=2048140 RepID=UPI00320A6343